MNNVREINRVDWIRLNMKRGDKKYIARLLDVHPEWVSRVIRGQGVSERVLRTAEALIAEREKQTN
ncbi:MAG: hypothetical protein IJC16_00020 [Rikenellaceae bacterium]|nr:hypothetical protein [Rikenellaceae bacterium]